MVTNRVTRIAHLRARLMDVCAELQRDHALIDNNQYLLDFQEQAGEEEMETVVKQLEQAQRTLRLAVNRLKLHAQGPTEKKGVA